MDDIMKEIFNRDSRTAVPFPKINRKSANLEFIEFNEICDNSQIRSTQNNVRSTLRSVKKYNKIYSKRLFNYLTLVLSIYIILLTNQQSEASPITRKNLNGERKFFNHKCGSPMSEKSTKMNDDILKRRLNDILISCEDTLFQAKELSKQYIKVMWNSTPEDHHQDWKLREVPAWLHPEGIPLKKQFSENISATHKHELENIEWKDHKKVFEYIGKIYQRLERIYVGVQIVNKWIEMAKERSDMMKPDELEKSQELFQNVTLGTNQVLCVIQDLFMDAEIDPSTDLDITPFRLDDLVKINHWLIYREYQNLMEYSNELLSLILHRYGGKN